MDEYLLVLEVLGLELLDQDHMGLNSYGFVQAPAI
jgi:hypothetical protein